MLSSEIRPTKRHRPLADTESIDSQPAAPLLAASTDTAHAALPPGASHFDRLPPELRDMIESLATPTLHLFLRRLRRWPFLAKDISRVVYHRDSLWTEVLETEWPGDLAMLPEVSEGNPCFLAVRSRQMFERLRNAGVEIRQVLVQRIAIRRGWLDMLDFGNVDVLAMAAAAEGCIPLLQDIIEVRRLVDVEIAQICSASKQGNLETVKWLSCRTRDPGMLRCATKNAASSGNLDLVKWLHGDNPLRQAWLASKSVATPKSGSYLNDEAGCCSELAFLLASWNSQAHILEFLRVQHPDVFAKLPDETFDDPDNVSMLAWIKQHRPKLSFQGFLGRFTSTGNIEALAWIVDNTSARLSHMHLGSAVLHDHVDMVKWMVLKKGIDICDLVFKCCPRWRINDSIAWMLKHDSRTASILAGRLDEE
ncbi:hypothetical protein HK105_201995 [Polyrhizophydium stewartii]|uniref:Ankyrin repeat protein n=1 Tax=Polyrhizophydium stewartii TaxID=2732419 RepID=A0ABR4NGD2_9FUNG